MLLVAEILPPTTLPISPMSIEKCDMDIFDNWLCIFEKCDMETLKKLYINSKYINSLLKSPRVLDHLAHFFKIEHKVITFIELYLFYGIWYQTEYNLIPYHCSMEIALEIDNPELFAKIGGIPLPSILFKCQKEKRTKMMQYFSNVRFLDVVLKSACGIFKSALGINKYRLKGCVYLAAANGHFKLASNILKIDPRFLKDAYCKGVISSKPTLRDVMRSLNCAKKVKGCYRSMIISACLEDNVDIVQHLAIGTYYDYKQWSNGIKLNCPNIIRWMVEKRNVDLYDVWGILMNSTEYWQDEFQIKSRSGVDTLQFLRERHYSVLPFFNIVCRCNDVRALKWYFQVFHLDRDVAKSVFDKSDKKEYKLMWNIIIDVM